MSGQGHMALGSTAASSTPSGPEHLDVAVTGRLSADSPGSLEEPVIAKASSASYNAGLQSGTYRWGDYSYTCVDPNDDMTMWTIQEFCNATDSYGCEVVQLL